MPFTISRTAYPSGKEVCQHLPQAMCWCLQGLRKALPVIDLYGRAAKKRGALKFRAPLLSCMTDGYWAVCLGLSGLARYALTESATSL